MMPSSPKSCCGTNRLLYLLVRILLLAPATFCSLLFIGLALLDVCTINSEHLWLVACSQNSNVKEQKLSHSSNLLRFALLLHFDRKNCTTAIFRFLTFLSLFWVLNRLRLDSFQLFTLPRSRHHVGDIKSFHLIPHLPQSTQFPRRSSE